MGVRREEQLSTKGEFVMLRMIANWFTRFESRRGFLTRLSSGAARLTMVMFGIREFATAGAGPYNVACCSLCANNNCSGNSPSNWTCSGTWAWTCIVNEGPPISRPANLSREASRPLHPEQPDVAPPNRCYLYTCYECYSSGNSNCYNSSPYPTNCCPGLNCVCNNINCSKAVNSGKVTCP